MLDLSRTGEQGEPRERASLDERATQIQYGTMTAEHVPGYRNGKPEKGR